ncbi:MAG TPA: hypothetical protein VFX16_18500 [Pseudonocardiaceae bacterium]|nr:hypothetical protein [Pseudonocardiaceae bacterium]
MAWTVEDIPTDGKQWLLHTAASGHGTTWAFGITAGQGRPFGTLVYRRVDDGWQRVDVPVIGRANRAVVLSPDEVWIVGDGTSMHGVGDVWREVPTAELKDSTGQLFGLVAFGSDLWTAGYAPHANHETGRGTVQRWDGTQWTDQELPGVAPMWGLAGLGGVAADDLWAVGTVHGEHGPAVAVHHDGAGWHRTDVPLPGDGSGTLKDVWALTSDDVWASGYWQAADRPGVRLPLLVHWDGSAWSIGDVPADTGQIGQLVATDDGLYGVGYTGGSPYVLCWDGAVWRSHPAPPSPEGARHCTLHGAAVLPDGRLLVVGATNDSARSGQPYAAVRS